jgi:two-component system nitrogen regulation sensor histidine kinase NtrY
VRDNGKGFPAGQRDRLVEPYITTRAKGTGLGLAIVKKVMEDHGGELMLEDDVQGGACVRLLFSADRKEPATMTSESDQPKVVSHGA